MDIKSVDLFTVVQFGTKELFEEKLRSEQIQLKQIINLTNERGISILEQCLINRKFDIAELLIKNGSEVNVISKDNCNELHYLSSNIKNNESIRIANQLIRLGVDLNLKDKKYGNTPFWYLCEKAIQINTEESNEMISICMEQTPNVRSSNVVGKTVEALVIERGNNWLNKVVLGE